MRFQYTSIYTATHGLTLVLWALGWVVPHRVLADRLNYFISNLLKGHPVRRIDHSHMCGGSDKSRVEIFVETIDSA